MCILRPRVVDEYNLLVRALTHSHQKVSILDPNCVTKYRLLFSMTSFRPFSSRDLLKYNLVNTDALTETYGLSFYLSYLAHWPEYFVASETVDGELSGYIMGKSEGEGCLFHGHVTAVTVAPPFRRQKIANKLMEKLERVTEDFHDAYFVDLFVRASNENAILDVRKDGVRTLSKSDWILRQRWTEKTRLT